MRASFEESRQRYGSPRIHEDLIEQDERVSRKRVIRLMQEDGLEARGRKLSDAWIYRLRSAESAGAPWSGTRASIIAAVLPRTVLLAIATFVSLLGWRMAALHTLYLCGVVVLLMQLTGLTIGFVPFAHVYIPQDTRI